MSNLTILRTYAKTAPESLPSSVLFKHSSKSITIFDGYPKSMFHFLVLPRLDGDNAWPKLDAHKLSGLRALLNRADRDQAKEVISALAEDAKAVKQEIEQEMIERYGFKWEIWTGFHGAPSMEHIHLHVLSADLCSEKMKHKKHYNSFHPKLGFFLHIEEVLSWFDAEPNFYANLVKNFNPSKYEPILKEKLVCFHCNSESKNMPTLKAHLQEEWDKLARRGKSSGKLKRKLPDGESRVEIHSHHDVQIDSSKRAKSTADDDSQESEQK